MGSPDFVHFGDRCYQVKCFGKYSMDLVPGRKVQLHHQCDDLTLFTRSDTANRLKIAYLKSQGIPDPFDIEPAIEAMNAAEARGEEYVPNSSCLQWATPWDPIITELWVKLHEGEPLDIHSYQVITRDGGYIVVLSDHVSHWQSSPLAMLPIVNNDGEYSREPEDGAWPSDELDACSICAVLKGEVEGAANN